MNLLQIILILSIMVLHGRCQDVKVGVRPQSLYLVMVNGRYGYIDATGKLVFETQNAVYNVRDYAEGYAVIAVKPPKGEKPGTQGKWGYIDVNGELAFKAEYDYCQSFSEGFAAVRMNGNWAYIDKMGKLLTGFDFYSAGDGAEMVFSEGRAAIRLFATPIKRYYAKYGYIDNTGRLAIDPQFDMAFPFSDGIARVMVEERIGKGRYGYIDKAGKVIVAPQYTLAGNFSEGLAFVQMTVDGKEKVGYIDKTGKLVIPAQFGDVYERIADSKDLRESNIYNRNGRERDFSEGYAAVQIDEKWGYVNREGKVVIQPEYRYAGRFREGLAPVAVRRGRKRAYGFIDKSGRLAIPLQFDDVGEFRDGLAKVFILDSHGEIDKLGYIDKTGRYIWKPIK